MSIAPSVFPLEREPIDTYTRRVTDATDLVIYRRWRVCTEEMKSDEVRWAEWRDRSQFSSVPPQRASGFSGRSRREGRRHGRRAAVDGGGLSLRMSCDGANRSSIVWCTSSCMFHHRTRPPSISSPTSNFRCSCSRLNRPVTLSERRLRSVLSVSRIKTGGHSDSAKYSARASLKFGKDWAKRKRNLLKEIRNWLKPEQLRVNYYTAYMQMFPSNPHKYVIITDISRCVYKFAINRRSLPGN